MERGRERQSYGGERGEERERAREGEGKVWRGKEREGERGKTDY